ncbi:gram-negative bacteria-binding protein 3 [Drosophila albomicans]|uniref:Gram-negative bacteria-binding protein 3 n=1 Tax=Drosophila albomicans TaxID=7291 RepID=A0A6P8YMI5_DROAB|nr:gram-negative bacteria-binding protein 3 [Drosophila albomicans]
MDSVTLKEATRQLMWPHLALIFCLAVASSNAYNVPNATVKVNTPRGFEVSIPDEPGISLFAFHGKLNEEMDDLSDQTWATDIVSSRNGRWTYRNRLQKLQPGDVLYYWITVRYNGLDYHNYNLEYKVCEETKGQRSTETSDGGDANQGNARRTESGVGNVGKKDQAASKRIEVGKADNDDSQRINVEHADHENSHRINLYKFT